jgi:ATP-binding protein involved in chromosome partitioning
MILTIGNKGGVGRSTITANTAVALAKQGYKVGVFDANIYGPSIPRILGTTNKIHMPNKEQFYSTISSFGVEEASVGNIIDVHDSLLWKAPYIGSVLGDFLLKAHWKDIDYLLVDTPSGTGDIHMALMTLFKPDAAIVVTTPDTLSCNETVRSIDMLKSIPLNIIGVVENMSAMKCNDCKKQVELFKGDAGKKLAEKYKIDNLGSIPLSYEVSEASENGVPVYTTTKDEKIKNVYENIAKAIVRKLPRRSPEEPTRKLENPVPPPVTI